MTRRAPIQCTYRRTRRRNNQCEQHCELQKESLADAASGFYLLSSFFRLSSWGQFVEKPILVRGARQLLTLRGPQRMRRGTELADLAVIEDGSLLIRDGLITQVGSTRRLENLKECRDAEELDATGAVVMPAFVDSAIHLASSAVHTQAGRVRVQDFAARSAKLLRSCLQHGTLHARLRIGGAGIGARQSLNLLKSFARSGMLPFRSRLAWHIDDRGPDNDAEADAIAALERLRAPGSASSPVSSIELAKECADAVRDRVWATAAARGLAVDLAWAGGCAGKLAQFLEAHPRRVLAAPFLADAECDLLAACGLPVICSPSAALDADRPPSTLPRLIEEGATLALGSGYDEQQRPRWSMQTAITLATLKLGLTTEQAISAATINAAWSIHAGMYTGSLEIGKNADLLLLLIDDYRELPRSFGVNLVRVAVRAGKMVFRA